MRIERIWAMPNKWTFTIPPIKKLLQEEVTGGLWADPFAGFHSPAAVTNDLNPESPATHHLVRNGSKCRNVLFTEQKNLDRSYS